MLGRRHGVVLGLAERIETSRLLLRKPRLEDAEAIYAGWAGDLDVTRYLSWPRHESIADTEAFLRGSDDEWSRWLAGPLLVGSRESGVVIGSTGLHFESANRAEVGYVFSRDAWGFGYATEAVRALLAEAHACAPLSVFASVHPHNAASMHVLEKCGFTRDGTLTRHAPFPNLDPDRLFDVARYSYAVA